MKILVPIKQILDPAGLTVNRKAGKVFVNKEDYRMNPASKCALEAALRLKETAGADVTVVSFGSAQTADQENTVREARAMGADRAILISSGAIDTAGVARALVALISYLGGVDLVVNGHRTLDTGISSGAYLAEALGWPYLGEAVDCSVNGEIVRITREDAATPRLYTSYEANLPAVVTVTRHGPKPRYAHGGDIITTYRDQNAVETLTVTDLGLADSDLATVTAERGQSFPPEREFGREVSLEEIAGRIR
jgi:electron transfer flavoprotein beta subunit